MAVYAVKWNRFHPKIFLSCSADWTVKMWDHTVKSPLIRFDLGFPVGDVAWAPYSSTIFSAITSDHKCHVYNLTIDKHSDVCDKKVIGGKLNKIAFNPT
jgi:dynein intermediate chain 1|mmetsp:Transcript_33469/g.6065  ORF Transcript_33469/g.6065 Transcript_33469/m.6065 type:complete len:99 (+) Transcript_33469:1520-1816(+)